MEHVAWKGHIKPGYKQEYIRRHNEIWPEMVDALKAAGCFTFYAPHDAKAAIKMFAQKGNSSIDEFPFCS